MANLPAVLFDLALLAPPLAVVLGVLTLVLPSRLRETPGAGVTKHAA